jgi:transcriptional regulator NrdR family protein
MTCPKCGRKIKVVDTEAMQSGGKPVVCRNRVCRPCGLTIRTIEQIVMTCKRATRERRKNNPT